MPVTVARGQRKETSKKEIVYFLEVSVSANEPGLVAGVAEALDDIRGYAAVEVLDVEVREVQVEGEGK